MTRLGLGVPYIIMGAPSLFALNSRTAVGEGWSFSFSLRLHLGSIVGPGVKGPCGLSYLLVDTFRAQERTTGEWSGNTDL